MTASAAFSGLASRREDVLEHLPISGTTEFDKGQTIYGPERLSKGIHLVVSGKVGVSHISGDGSTVLLEIVLPDELFGESAFLAVPPQCELATALEPARLMTWTIADIEDLVLKRPRLAVALLQMLAQRSIEFANRIESLTKDNAERRLARSLLRFSERIGTPQEDGSMRMMPVTHALLSQYVGTTREVVTVMMNKFRKQGYLTYSRQGIFLHCDALKKLLDKQVRLPVETSS
jgi:CRP/FNR family transcriptional regulator